MIRTTTLVGLMLTLSVVAYAGAPKWRVTAGSGRCTAKGILNETDGVADLRLTKCKGKSKPFKRGTLRLVVGDLIDGAHLVAKGYDCTYLGSFVLGTGCDSLFNCTFGTSDADCANAPPLSVQRLR